MDVPGPTDEALLTAIRAGQLEAFDELYRRYAGRLFGYIRRFAPEPSSAEDLFQEVFMKVLRDRTYDPKRGRFSAWVFTVARNACRMQQRRVETRARHDAAAQGPAADADLEDAVGRRRQVRAAIAGLPEDQRQLLLLKQVGDLTYREIADIHGVAEGTVKSRLHAAMKAFRTRLAAKGEGS
jgi:RNA polymerase sigma-70 factor (ECF subfamily)